MVKAKKKWWQILLIIIGILIAAVVVFFGILTITEFKPADTEVLEINGDGSKTIARGDTLNIVTWNVGYCGLGEGADFFMDGGKSVRSSDKATVENNIAAIASETVASDPDVVFMQEVDVNSKRSYGTNQFEAIGDSLTGYCNTFATNYKVLYIPYPWPPMGHVDCGIATFSKYNVTDSTRIQLPCPFSYPARLGNLKRWLMVDRVPIEDSDKELVLVNLHLEAYDSGEGKIAQTNMLKELLEEEANKGNYVIAGGDFNQIFSNIDSSAYPLVSEEMWQPGVVDINEFSDKLQFIMDNQVASCRSLDRPLTGNDTSPDKFQYYIIDGFIVSDNMMVQQAGVKDLGFVNSDHNPLYMKVRLK